MVQTAIPEFMTCHLEFSRLGFSPKNEEWRQAPCGMWVLLHAPLITLKCHQNPRNFG
jgi:hypothetical protein